MSGSRFSLAGASTGLLEPCEREADRATVRSARDDEPAGGPPAAPAVDDWVAQQIKDAYRVDDVFRDEDGDIAIPLGSSVVFVRSYEPGSPFLQLHALLLADCEPSPEVFCAVNAVNAQLSLPKVMIDAEKRQIYLEAWLLIGSLSSHDLLFAIEFVADAADHFGPLLQEGFGGRLMIDNGCRQREVRAAADPELQ
jgi:hypothetical protein